MKKPTLALVGKAFRSRSDGRIRWITNLSTRSNYTLLWLDEETNIWWQGGHVDAATFDKFYGGDEVDAPIGSYKLAGVFGGFRVVVLPAAELLMGRS
jgi:hypothetical protein